MIYLSDLVSSVISYNFILDDLYMAVNRQKPARSVEDVRVQDYEGCTTRTSKFPSFF